MSNGRVLRSVALGGAAALWAPILYSSSWHTLLGKNADHANAVLAGHEIATGNPLLSGWVLPLNSYWSLDLPFFGVFTAVFGVRPIAMNAVPVFIATAVLVVAGWIAWENSASLRGRVLGVGVVSLLLGLPHPLQANYFLQGPEHVATALFCLVAFLLLSGARLGRPRWLLGVGVMAAAVLGDAFALAIGAAPVLVAGAVASLRQRRWAPVLGFGAAAFGAVGGAALIRLALNRFHAHLLAPALPLSPAENRVNNFNAIRRLIPSLLGFGEASGLSTFFQIVHLVGVMVFVAGLVASVFVTIKRLSPATPERERDAGVERSRWFDDALLAGFFGGLVVYVLIALPPLGVPTSRYLLPSLIYGVVLTARRATAMAERLPQAWARGICVLTLVMLCLYGGAWLDVIRQPTVENPAEELAGWLSANGLTSGYGSYWAASPVTVFSEEAVTVRPVVAVQGRLHGWQYYASSKWFDGDDGRPRRFLVFEPELPFGGVSDEVAVATFGPFARAVDLGRYRILIWEKDLFPALGPTWRET